METWVPAASAGPANDVLLRHGYTMTDIQTLTHAAVRRDVFHQSLPFPDRLDIAWSAIAEHLYSCDEKPERYELIRAAWSALRAEAESDWHTHGVARQASVFDGDQSMLNYWRYWFPLARNRPGPEDMIVERLAVQQIWAVLPEKHKSLIAALAVHDDYGIAARSLGMPRQSFAPLLSLARRAFRELWHEGETPSGHWSTDRRGNPGAQHRKTHPNRNAGREVVARKRRQREREQQFAADGRCPRCTYMLSSPGHTMQCG